MRKPELTTSKSPRAWLWPLLILVIFLAAFFPFYHKNLIFRDSFYYFAPAKFLIREALRRGTIYFWNPWLFLGLPFVADPQAGWFYPLNVIYLALPFGLAHRVFILLHYPIAGLGMYLLLRGRGVRVEGALVAGLAFPFSGYLLSHHGNMVYLLGPALAPYALYGFERARSGSRAWALVAGAALALQILGGEPQSAGITAGLVAAAGALAAATSPRALQPLLLVALAGVAAFAFSAVQIFPTLELIRQSIRGSGISFAESALFSFHPARMIELIWPTPFGAIWPEVNYWGKALSDAPAGLSNIPWTLSEYLGLPVLLLAGTGMIAGRRREKLFLGAGALFFFLLSLGHFAPFFEWLYRGAPLVRLFRYPEKYMAWFTFFMAVSAGLGVEEIFRLRSEKPRALKAGALVYLAGVLVLFGLALWLWPKVLPGLTGFSSGSPALETAAQHFRESGKQFVAVNLALGLLLYVFSQGGPRPRLILALAVAVLVLDWWLANVRIIPTGPPDMFSFRPAAAQAINPEGRPTLGQFRVFRRDIEFRDLNPALHSYPRFERQCIWERSTLKRNFNFMEGLEEVTGLTPYVIADGIAVLRDNLTPRTLGLYNVRYIIALADASPFQSAKSEIVYRDSANDFSITALPEAFPRAFWVPAASAVREEKAALVLLDQVDLRKTVVLITPENIELADPGDRRMTPAKILRYEPDEVELESESDRAGWLVLSDRFYPGWEAEVDGRPAAIYRANVLVRAVRLGPGKHLIRFSYRPRSLYLGAAISIPAWIGLGLFLIIGFIRKRNRV